MWVLQWQWFILLIVVSIAKIVAEYVTLDNLKQVCLQALRKFQGFTVHGIIHLIIQSGDVETNPSPKTSKNQCGAKIKFVWPMLMESYNWSQGVGYEVSS